MSEPAIVEFGPARVIGFTYVGQNKNHEIPTLWQQFCSRAHEIAQTNTGYAFGICRCGPKELQPTSGGFVFEYVGGLHASNAATVPSEMKEVIIPRGHYIAVDVPSVKEIGQVWASLGSVVAKFPEWEPNCSPQGCNCATHPSFEFYPPDFTIDQPFKLYISIRKKAG